MTATEQLKAEHRAIKLVLRIIDKEDNVLYPIADARLPKNVQDELLTKFDKVETKKIGEGKHEEFHRMLENLEKVYLV